jgi:hypothetical protein
MQWTKCSTTQCTNHKEVKFLNTLDLFSWRREREFILLLNWSLTNNKLCPHNSYHALAIRLGQNRPWFMNMIGNRNSAQPMRNCSMHPPNRCKEEAWVGRVVGGEDLLDFFWFPMCSHQVLTVFSTCSPSSQCVLPPLYVSNSKWVCPKFYGFCKISWQSKSFLTPTWARIVSLGRWNDPYSKK